MHSVSPSINYRISTIDDHGTAEMMRISLIDEDGEGSTLQARKYDITRADMKVGDSVSLTVVPEFEDTIPDDIGVVKIRAKVTFITSSVRSLVPELPETKHTMIFFADWMPWIVNPKVTLRTKIAKELGIKVGDIVKLIISKYSA